MNSIYELETVSATTKCLKSEQRFTATAPLKQAESTRLVYQGSGRLHKQRILIQSFYRAGSAQRVGPPNGSLRQFSIR
jgi:hypothetical protein